jgi:hypothetical protein
VRTCAVPHLVVGDPAGSVYSVRRQESAGRLMASPRVFRAPAERGWINRSNAPCASKETET